MSRSLLSKALLALCLALAVPAVAAPVAGAANPLVGQHWFVDTTEPSWGQALSDRAGGDYAHAFYAWLIASEPKFHWFGRFNHNPRAAIRKYIGRAKAQGQVPLIATLRHQGKRCSPHYTAGGRAEDRRTMKWFKTVAKAIGRDRAVIAFEPDSLGTIKCLARSRRKARLKVLRYGVSQFAKLPNATTYLEAAASDWVNYRTIAKRLRYIGVRKVRGFMLNATHYDWTANNIRYGRKISHLVGGKHFIISTSWNGRGPVHYNKRVHGHTRRITVQCHPLLRGLGPAPTTQTADPLVDAYMWVGRPGYSGGKCNGGPLPVGKWWPARAYMFGKYATNWIRPPRGTRFGFPRGQVSVRDAAGPSNYP